LPRNSADYCRSETNLHKIAERLINTWLQPGGTALLLAPAVSTAFNRPRTICKPLKTAGKFAARTHRSEDRC
jgi:hypothetical protein